MASPNLSEMVTTTKRSRGKPLRQTFKPQAPQVKVKVKVKQTAPPAVSKSPYSTGPKVPAAKVTTKKLTQTGSLGDATPLMVAIHPGVTTAFGGAAHAGGARIPKSSGYGHSVVNRLGSLRLSGHVAAHRLGKRG